MPPVNVLPVAVFGLCITPYDNWLRNVLPLQSSHQQPTPPHVQQTIPTGTVVYLPNKLEGTLVAIPIKDGFVHPSSNSAQSPAEIQSQWTPIGTTSPRMDADFRRK
jgi:hypothetical protein